MAFLRLIWLCVLSYFANQVPAGPFNSVDDVTHQVKLWAGDPKINPGGFAMAKAGLRAPTTNKGQRQRYNCVAKECKFELQYELTFEGWALYDWRHEHGDHVFHTANAESMADAGCHTLPPSYSEFFHILAKSGDKTAAVMKKLAVRAEMDNLTPTWSKDFIKSKLRAYASNQELDVRRSC